MMSQMMDVKYKFVLLMIVKDEQSIVTRALDSLKHLFDYYIICDTGSTDFTKIVIESWGATNDKPGEIIDKEWKNFGFNKSYLWKYAREKFATTADYFVFLDADEVFITDPSNPLSYLTTQDVDKLYTQLQQSKNSVFQMLTLYSGLKYKRWNIARNNQLYEWLQPVHEYLNGTVDNSTEFIDWVYNLARKEGNSSRNPGRYQKDAVMFEEFLMEHPGEPRATFYLAQTYESFNVPKALEWYDIRINLDGGFYQERYIACLRAGRLSSKYEDKIKYWMKGTTVCPHRLECVYELMMQEYSKGKHLQAMCFGMLASNSSRTPLVDDLFVEQSTYEYLFDLNFAVSCYYAKEYTKGIEANYRAMKLAPPSLKQQILNNLKFFPPTSNSASEPARSVVASNVAASNANDACLIVIDEFYSNPDSIRSYALSQEFTVTGNYPGKRTSCQLHHSYFSNIKQRFEQILGRTITYWPEGYNSSFQIATEDLKSWIHRDKTEWSVIVFLTPDAPAYSGTKFFRHIATDAEFAVNDDHEAVMNQDTYNNDSWELVDQVGNKYNRCVFFRGKRCHISGDYFGTDLYSGRLFQTFFFNTN